jgi:DNA repair photolyase
MKAVETLTKAGGPVGVLVAPVIPALKQLFLEWLEVQYPGRASHIISLIQQMNGGKDYDSNFATRVRGQGVLADIIRKRVQVA